ncbi:MAG: nucleotidyltransferase domain-containing protein, partial [Caulobacter sp.]|nr:nucleotidyltransferase domain-containing protein [Caulobacter sp.]
MFSIRELDNEQRRQTIDLRQIFEAWEDKRRLAETRFAGSMRWVRRGDGWYLLRKRGRAETSLGPRSAETERTHARFVEGRERIADDLKALEARLARLAPVAAAMGLGRVPKLTARLLRRLADAGLLGTRLHIVGTNALFAYEAAAGVQFDSGLLATGDADLMLDARRRLRLVVEALRVEGVLGVLRRVDKSFAPRGPRDFRAVNRDGFRVDLIRAETRRESVARPRDRIGESDEDLQGAPLPGLSWLVGSPKFQAVALDEAGFPVRLHTIDPRAFALHKAWIAGLPGRDPLKRGRDLDQAAAVASVAADRLGLDFAAADLPAALRAAAPRLLAAGSRPADPE